MKADGHCPDIAKSLGASRATLYRYLTEDNAALRTDSPVAHAVGPTSSGLRVRQPLVGPEEPDVCPAVSVIEVEVNAGG